MYQAYSGRVGEKEFLLLSIGSGPITSSSLLRLLFISVQHLEWLLLGQLLCSLYSKTPMS